MSAWMRKATLDAIKTILPMQASLRDIKRKISPYQTNPANDPGLLGDAMRQLTALQALSVGILDADVVEIGTGWNPVLPLLYRLCGAARVTTVDQERLLDLPLSQAALAYISDHLGEISRRVHFTLPLSFDRVPADGVTLESFLAGGRISYCAPFDFTDLPDASAHLIVSRAVLEHVAEAKLADIFAHSRRVLRPGGVLCHTIDMSDHWQHGDKTISRVNFLKYDGLMWQFFCLNAQNYQNRLRRFEYLALFEQNGFEVLNVTGAPDEAALAALKTLPLTPRYRTVPHAQLAILTTMIIARKR